MRTFLLIAILIGGSFVVISQTNQPSTKMNAQMMRELRLKMLTAAPSDFGQKPTPEFPRVYGVLMDWPVEVGTNHFISTVVSFSTGDASIYTTGTFGVMGGIGHQTVRYAAKDLVRAGEKHYEEATPTKDFSYPKAGQLRFYLVCYEGVRVIETDVESARSGIGKDSDMYEEAHRVITEIRLITQRQKGEIR